MPPKSPKPQGPKVGVISITPDMMKNRVPPQMPPPMQPTRPTPPVQEFSNMTVSDTNTESTAIYEEITETEHIVCISLMLIK